MTRLASTMSPDQPQVPQKQTNTRSRAGPVLGSQSLAAVGQRQAPPRTPGNT